MSGSASKKRPEQRVLEATACIEMPQDVGWWVIGLSCGHEYKATRFRPPRIGKRVSCAECWASGSTAPVGATAKASSE